MTFLINGVEVTRMEYIKFEISIGLYESPIEIDEVYLPLTRDIIFKKDGKTIIGRVLE